MKLKPIDKLVDTLFSRKWQPLPSETRALSAMFKPGTPGVYVLAYPESHRDLSTRVAQPKDVYYVGMTNSKWGLRGRLKGFVKSANGTSKQHSAGVEFFKQNKSRPYRTTCQRRQIFFITFSIDCCTVKSEATAEDFYEMGNIACLEYYVVAKVKQTIGRVPPLNRSVGGLMEG